MVSYLKPFTNKGCKIAGQKNVYFGKFRFNYHSVNFARIRRLYNKDPEFIQQGSGGYTTKIRRFYNKDPEVISIFFGISATILFP